LFNEDTVDKVLAHVMSRGLLVAGDRLGKTIVFAKNQEHAKYIAERFDANYPHYKGEFARVITFETEYAQSLIDGFSNKEKAPHIAISVDMLDTGIDVPECVNLVFFKLVRSKTKFWQMVGRGTRLCPDLFGPGQDKQFFYLFDYCQNLEYFNQNLATTDGAVGASLAKRLFVTRLELVGALDERLDAGARAEVREASPGYGDPVTDAQVQGSVVDRLRDEVAAMNLDNFLVRPKRRLVEKYSRPEAWAALSKDGRRDLADQVAGLPTELPTEDEEAKRFDLLLLRLQLAVLHAEPSFDRLRDQVKAIAGLLEEKSTIPMVHAQMVIIEEIQSDEWWRDVTIPMLERVRRRLRDLVKLIEKKKRKPIYSDFEDVMGAESEIARAGLADGSDYVRFKAKARDFLRAHQDHIAINKLRMNKRLTPTDLAELERMLAESGVAAATDLQRAKQEAAGLGLFVRSLIGLDREAAKAAMAGFMAGKAQNASQIEFVNLVVDHLTDQGVLDAARLYESPFTDVSPRGPDGLFTSQEIDALFASLAQVRESATAA
jgi:type I restriction enzyme R subunit